MWAKTFCSFSVNFGCSSASWTDQDFISEPLFCNLAKLSESTLCFLGHFCPSFLSILAEKSAFSFIFSAIVCIWLPLVSAQLCSEDSFVTLPVSLMRLKCPLTPPPPPCPLCCCRTCCAVLGKQFMIPVLWVFLHSSVLISVDCVQEACELCQKIFGQFLRFWGACCFLSLIFLRCKFNSYLRPYRHLFSSENNAKSSYNLAPKSPCSVRLRVHTAACVYKVQMTRFIVWRQFHPHHFCVVAEVFGFFNFLLRKTLWPFFWGQMVVGTEYKTNLTGSQMNWLSEGQINEIISENVGSSFLFYII